MKMRTSVQKLTDFTLEKNFWAWLLIWTAVFVVTCSVQMKKTKANQFEEKTKQTLTSADTKKKRK